MSIISYREGFGPSIISPTSFRNFLPFLSFLNTSTIYLASWILNIQVKNMYVISPAREAIPVRIIKFIVLVVSNTSWSKSFIGTYNATPIIKVATEILIAVEKICFLGSLVFLSSSINIKSAESVFEIENDAAR